MPSTIHDITAESHNMKSLSISQVLKRRKKRVEPDIFIPLTTEVIHSPDELFASLPKSYLQVANALFFYTSNYDRTFISQETLARDTELSLATVKRALRKLYSLGMFKKVYRSRKTCIYIADDYFLNPITRPLMARFFSNLAHPPTRLIKLKKTVKAYISPTGDLLLKCTEYIYKTVSTCKTTLMSNFFPKRRSDMDEKDISLLTGNRYTTKNPKRGISDISSSHPYSVQTKQTTPQRPYSERLNGIDPYRPWQKPKQPSHNPFAELDTFDAIEQSGTNTELAAKLGAGFLAFFTRVKLKSMSS